MSGSEKAGDSGKLAKACIRFLKPSGREKQDTLAMALKALAQGGKQGARDGEEGRYFVQFNPTELQIAVIRGTKRTKRDFQPRQKKIPQTNCIRESSGGMTLTLKLDLDKSLEDEGSVQNEVEGFLSAAGEAGEGRQAAFYWGEFSFIGTIGQVSAEYVMFSSQGKPIRAKLDFTLTCKEQRLLEEMTGEDIRTLFG